LAGALLPLSPEVRSIIRNLVVARIWRLVPGFLINGFVPSIGDLIFDKTREQNGRSVDWPPVGTLGIVDGAVVRMLGWIPLTLRRVEIEKGGTRDASWPGPVWLSLAILSHLSIGSKSMRMLMLGGFFWLGFGL